jgi:hypothetical protein
MRFALWGLVLAAVVFVASGGHILFLPRFSFCPSAACSDIVGDTAAGGSPSGI